MKKNNFGRKIICALMILVMMIGMLPLMEKSASAASRPGYYRFYFDFNGATSGKSFETYYPAGIRIAVPAAPKKTCGSDTLLFLGWECSGKLYKAGEVLRVSGNMSFKAIWGVAVSIFVREYDNRGVRIMYEHWDTKVRVGTSIIEIGRMRGFETYKWGTGSYSRCDITFVGCRNGKNSVWTMNAKDTITGNGELIITIQCIKKSEEVPKIGQIR